MKQYFLWLSILILLGGCSIKMETNNYGNGITEFRDNINGDTIIVKMKNNYCLPNAKILFSQFDTVRKIKLSKNCRVKSIKDYTKNNILLQELSGNTFNTVAKGLTKYIDDRKRINTINGKGTTKSYNQYKLDKNGFNNAGWNNIGINKITLTEYDTKGYNRGGFDRNGFTKDDNIYSEQYIGKFNADDNKCAKNGRIIVFIENNRIRGHIEFKRNGKILYPKLSGKVVDTTIKGKTNKLKFIGTKNNTQIVGTYKNKICNGTFILNKEM
jgi:hypothetical protein